MKKDIKGKYEEMISLAIDAREKSYSPYSNFKVGACLRTSDGTHYTGCNVENSAFSPSCCAERTAFFKAVSDGRRSFDSIAIVGGKGIPDSYCPPCGVCRQVMMEFCNPKTFNIIVAKSENDYKKYSLDEMLYLGFGPGNLN